MGIISQLNGLDTFRTLGLVASGRLLLLKDMKRSRRFVSKIPLDMYQTGESRFFPRSSWSRITDFRRLNPEFNWLFFDKRRRDSYMQKNWGSREIYRAYQSANFGQTRADIFRYCIVFERGGFYFDANKGCSSPIMNFLEPKIEGVVSLENNNCSDCFPEETMFENRCVGQWGFGFVAGHPLLGNVIEEIERSWRDYRGVPFDEVKQGVLKTTATWLFTRQTVDYLRAARGGLLQVCDADFYGTSHRLFPSSGFYPAHNKYASVKNYPVFE